MAFTLTLASTPALGGEPQTAAPADAQTAWKRGQALFGKGRYREAMAEFEKGHRLTGRGGFLFNAAECARLLGERKLARDLYIRYLRSYPEGSHRAQALSLCEALEAGRCTPAAATRPAPRPIAQPPAHSKARAVPRTAPVPPRNAFAVGAGGPVPAERPVARHRRPFYRHWAFWTSLGAVVVAGVVTGTVVAVRGRSSRPDADFTVDARSAGLLRW